MRLEEIRPGNVISGIVPGKLVSVVAADMRGVDALELAYRVDGSLGQRRLSRADEDGVLLVSDPPVGTGRRLADPRILSTLVLLIALAFGAYWFRSRPNTDGPVSNDMPVVIRTNGGWLEVATVKHLRTFNLTQVRTLLGYTIPFCKETAAYTVDTHITYRVRLAKHWPANYQKQRLRVVAPKLEPALPVAFDTSTLRATLQKCAVMPSLDTQNDLLKRISTTLAQDAQSPGYVEFARRNGARDTVSEFVRKWLISQKGYNIPPDVPIDVVFDDEGEPRN